MAYNPADLRLPPWLLRLLDMIVSMRIPISASWHIGMTRAGALLFFSLLGLWAAAFYSGNNLLYLCGGMLTAIALTALLQGVILLRHCPSLGSYLPAYSQAHSPIIIHHNIAGMHHLSALIDVFWAQASLHLQIRLSAQEHLLMGNLQANHRDYTSLITQTLKTSAPLGLWELEYQRNDHGSWVVLPSEIPWNYTAKTQPDAQIHQYTEGDSYHDLRAYIPGDTVARIHWRKSTAEQSSWRIKRFIQTTGESNQHDLCVDLRLTNKHTLEDFERLLGMAWYWLKSQPKHTQNQLILGQQIFQLNNAKQHSLAIQAIASAQPEQQPPIKQSPLLLSLHGSP